MKFDKKVLLPIKVAEGIYCWGKSSDNEDTRICEHFSNPGAHPQCSILYAFDGYISLKYDKEGYVKKPRECLLLKEVK